MREELEREYIEYVQARLPRLRMLAYRLCGDHDDADDLVQSAVTTLYVRWKQVRSADNMEAYVHTIVVRTFVKERRRPSAPIRTTNVLPELTAPEGLPADERIAVRAALRRLPPRQQAVLVLRFLCDLPVSEVAALLGCAAGTVKSQTSDGLAQLRRSLTGSAFVPAEGRNRR